jgi:hypothetical protein
MNRKWNELKAAKLFRWVQKNSRWHRLTVDGASARFQNVRRCRAIAWGNFLRLYAEPEHPLLDMNFMERCKNSILNVSGCNRHLRPNGLRIMVASRKVFNSRPARARATESHHEKIQTASVKVVTPVRM